MKKDMKRKDILRQVTLAPKAEAVTPGYLKAAISRTLEDLKKSNSPEALSALAWHQAQELHQKGKLEQACRKLESAHEWAKSIENPADNIINRQQVAVDFYLWGRYERAREMIEGISDRLMHDLCWYSIAEGFIKQGDRLKALETTALCPDPKLRPELYLRLAEKLHQAGRTQQALQTVDLALAVTDGFKAVPEKMEGMLETARVLIKMGFTEKGLALAGRVLKRLPGLKPGLEKWRLLQQAAALHQKAGEGPKSVALARKLLGLVVSEKSALSGRRPEDWAIKQSQAGHLLMRLADMLLLEGREDLALKTLSLTGRGGTHEHFCYLLACSAAERGKTRLAEKLLKKISLLHLQLLVRLKQAEWEAQTGRPEEATEIIMGAAEGALTLHPGPASIILRTAALLGFKHKLKGIDSAGLMERAFALSSAEGQSDGWHQNQYALHFVRIGRLQRAVELAESIPDPVNRISALENIARTAAGGEGGGGL